MSEKSLEEKFAEMEKEVIRLKAVYEIQNLMNKYEWYLPAGRFAEVMDLFAKKTPGIRAEIGSWGVYEGVDGIRRLLGPGGLHEWMQGKQDAPQPGLMFSVTNTTPVIEVAGDLETAKAVWICPGHSTKPVEPGGKPKAHWSWAKRAADFVIEDGEWKIWHYHVYGVFMTPYEKSWTDLDDPAQAEKKDFSELPENMRPDKPSSHPLWMYHSRAIWEYVPAAPEPYESFDEKTAY